MKVNMADANWVAAVVPSLLINALKFRLSAPFEGRCAPDPRARALLTLEHVRC